jgi:uncharacterized membrane protein YbhN (UPF0104 family)
MRELVGVLSHLGPFCGLGSLSLPVCPAVILLSILRGLRVSVGLGTVMVVYLGVSSSAAFVPSPGGIGGLDVALAAGLAATGVTAAVAVGAMLGYRMVTVWLPLVPAACIFVVLCAAGSSDPPVCDLLTIPILLSR